MHCDFPAGNGQLLLQYILSNSDTHAIMFNEAMHSTVPYPVCFIALFWAPLRLQHIFNAASCCAHVDPGLALERRQHLRHPYKTPTITDATQTTSKTTGWCTIHNMLLASSPCQLLPNRCLKRDPGLGTYLPYSSSGNTQRALRCLWRDACRVTNMGPVENMTVEYLLSSHRFHWGSACTSWRRNGWPGLAIRKSLEKPTGRVCGMMKGYLRRKSRGLRHSMSRSM